MGESHTFVELPTAASHREGKEGGREKRENGKKEKPK
jgi:hypothetical protein